MQVSILSEVRQLVNFFFFATLTSGNIVQRRTRQPYGMEGGGPGALGRNTWLKKCRPEDGDYDEKSELRTRDINIGGKATVWMGKGDQLVLETPGGGAWGAPEGKIKGLNDHIVAWEPRGSIAERAAAQASF